MLTWREVRNELTALLTVYVRDSSEIKRSSERWRRGGKIFYWDRQSVHNGWRISSPSGKKRPVTGWYTMVYYTHNIPSGRLVAAASWPYNALRTLALRHGTKRRVMHGGTSCCARLLLGKNYRTVRKMVEKKRKHWSFLKHPNKVDWLCFTRRNIHRIRLCNVLDHAISPAPFRMNPLKNHWTEISIK